MKKRIALVLSIVVILVAFSAISGVSLANEATYSLPDFQRGASRWSNSYIYKSATDMQAYCTAYTITSGASFICRLYLADKTTQAMINPMAVASTSPEATGAITYGPGTGYYVYMNFKNSGSKVLHANGVWGARN